MSTRKSILLLASFIGILPLSTLAQTLTDTIMPLAKCALCVLSRPAYIAQWGFHNTLL